MPDFIKRAAIIIAAIVVIIFLSLGDYGSEGRVYDCGMAEWHPDIPPRVKEECRKLHLEEWRRQQQEEANKKLIRT